MNYSFSTDDGAKYAIEIQNIGPELAFAILDLIRGVKTTMPVAVVPTYSEVAHAAVRLHPDNKINAIKEMRSRTSLGLKEAKDCIDYAMGSSGYYRPLYFDKPITKGTVL
jgi:hypothetical protein